MRAPRSGRCTAHGVTKDAKTELAPQRLDAKPAAPLASAVPLPAAAPLFGAACWPSASRATA